MKLHKRILLLVGAALIMVVAYFYGQNVALQRQLHLLDALRTASSIVFAIFGAWMAVVYTRVLQDMGSRSAEQRRSALMRVEHIFVPLMFSTFVLVVSLILTFAVPLGEEIAFLRPWREELLGFHYAGVCMLLLIQVAVLIMFFVPLAHDYREAERKHKERESKEKRRPLRADE